MFLQTWEKRGGKSDAGCEEPGNLRRGRGKPKRGPIPGRDSYQRRKVPRNKGRGEGEIS